MPVYAKSIRHFYYKHNDAQIEFKLGSDSKATAITITINGQEYNGAKDEHPQQMNLVDIL